MKSKKFIVLSYAYHICTFIHVLKFEVPILRECVYIDSKSFLIFWNGVASLSKITFKYVIKKAAIEFEFHKSTGKNLHTYHTFSILLRCLFLSFVFLVGSSFYGSLSNYETPQVH